MGRKKMSEQEKKAKRQGSSSSDYQQGFSPEGAALLARRWEIEDNRNYSEFSLAKFMNQKES